MSHGLTKHMLATARM